MLHVVINPAAGNGRAARIGARVVQALREKGILHSVSHTQRAGHATLLARTAADEGAATVIAVGGDGTVCETARGLRGTDTALGIIPAGTGNDIVKILRTPRIPLEALDYILKNPARAVDAGLLGDELFLNICGTGFDVCVLDHTLSAKRYVSGILPYLWGVLRAIVAYRPVVATISADGEAPVTKPLLLFAVANGQYLGGGMNVAPRAEPDDGLLDLIVIDSIPRWRLPLQLVRLLTGRILSIPGIQYRRCRRAEVSARGMRLNVDGEIVPMEEASFSVLPRAIAVHW